MSSYNLNVLVEYNELYVIHQKHPLVQQHEVLVEY